MKLSKEKLAHYAAHTEGPVKAMDRELLERRERDAQEPFCRINAIEKANIDKGIYAVVDIPSRHPTDAPLYLAPPAPVTLTVNLANAFIAAIEKEQDRLHDEDYLMDSRDCIDVIREELQRLNDVPPAPVVSDDYFTSLVAAARIRADKAMTKFPQPNYVLNKVAEESGEVIKAVIHYMEGREQWSSVEGELIDNLAMLIRLVKEGDQVIGFTPPDACRAAMHGSTISNSADIAIDEGSQSFGNSEQLNSPAVPEGWVMVPIELTPRMITKLQQNTEIGSYIAANWAGAYGLFQKFWDEAIAAAPKQESE